MSAYLELERRFHRLSALGDALSFLHWDTATVMPEGSSASRGEQISVLSSVRHEFLTADDMGDLLDAADVETGLSDWQRANLREMRRRWVHATALTSDLVEALAKSSMAAEVAWRNARPAGDYKLALPTLKPLVGLVKEKAAAKAGRLGKTPYDALMDQYTPGLTSDAVETVFSRLRAFLPGFLDTVMDKQARDPAGRMPEGPFPIGDQRRVAHRFMKALGFDFETGRIDESRHPFSGGTPDDLRITTRYDENDVFSGLMGVLHETGHALYEKGLPKDWRRQPVGQSRGMDLHESQSLLIEMQVCRSREFLSYAGPILAETFGGETDDWSVENLSRLYTKVDRSLIRVDADEVTYPLHVILRFNLEKQILSDALPLEDLPQAWREGMRELIGVDVPSDKDGCLQDIHWYDGAFGYFPSYTFGALTAAQLYDAARRSDAEIPAGIGRGDFKPLYAWLGKNVHGIGSLKETPEIVAGASGEPLNPDYFIRHLENRYLN